jgi:hypothetical protein
MSTAIADTSFNIKAPALAALHLLAARDKMDLVPTHLVKKLAEHKHRIQAETFPVYNGRERNVCLVLSYALDRENRKLLLMFGEVRNSDGNFLQKQKIFGSPFVYDQPTMKDFTDESYIERLHFDHGRFDQLIAAILGAAQEFYGEIIKE